MKKQTDLMPAFQTSFWNPFNPFEDFFRWENDFPFFRQRLPLEPTYHVHESDDSYELDLVAPGLNKEEISVQVKDQVLEISYSTQQDDSSSEEKARSRSYLRSEFRKQFHLSKNMDRENLEARYENGILKLRIPKKNQDKAPVLQVPVQ